jgi:hypothetical protein
MTNKTNENYKLVFILFNKAGGGGENSHYTKLYYDAKSFRYFDSDE